MLNFGGIKPHEDKMLTKMYNFCPPSLKEEKEEQDATSSVDYSLSQKRPDRGGLRLIDKLFTPHIV
jgi:hypothetical protein